MRSREYTKRVEIWQTTAVADGVGGSTVSEVLIGTSWAKITTSKSSQRLLDLGVTDPVNTIIVNIRHREDIDFNAVNQFIKYRSVNYIIQNAPRNVNFNDVDIEIIATREMTSSV